LSSGLRINSAKDDATGLALAMGIDSKVKGTNMAIRTANDGISSAQTADGLLGQVSDNLQRIREISVQTNGAGSVEATALATENARIFALPEMTIAAAVVNNSAGTTYAMTGAAAVTAATTASALVTGPQAATAIDTAITSIASARAALGADMSSLSSAVSNLQTSSVNLSAAYSRIMDTDYAAETAAMTRNNILQQAGTAVLAQANQTPQSVMTLLR
jgi:flagellin